MEQKAEKYGHSSGDYVYLVLKRRKSRYVLFGSRQASEVGTILNLSFFPLRHLIYFYWLQPPLLVPYIMTQRSRMSW